MIRGIPKAAKYLKTTTNVIRRLLANGEMPEPARTTAIKYKGGVDRIVRYWDTKDLAKVAVPESKDGKIKRLEAENAKLREEIEELKTCKTSKPTDRKLQYLQDNSFEEQNGSEKQRPWANAKRYEWLKKLEERMLEIPIAERAKLQDWKAEYILAADNTAASMWIEMTVDGDSPYSHVKKFANITKSIKEARVEIHRQENDLPILTCKDWRQERDKIDSDTARMKVVEELKKITSGDTFDTTMDEIRKYTKMANWHTDRGIIARFK